MIPPFDESTGGLPPGDHTATLTEISKRLGFTPRRRWLIKGLRQAVKAFWAAGIDEIYIDGSFCTIKPDPGDIDGYWVEPSPAVYDRLDPHWIDFELILVEFFIHPAMDAVPDIGFPEFFRQDREGRPRGIVRVVRDTYDQD